MQLTTSLFLSYITVLTAVLLGKRGRRIPQFLFFFWYLIISDLILPFMRKEYAYVSCTSLGTQVNVYTVPETLAGGKVKTFT